MKKLRFYLCLGLAVTILFLPLRAGWAAFRLTLIPFEGGYDLRFGRIDVDTPKVARVLTVRITTDIGKQYRVFQRLEQPLSASGGINIGRDQLKMYTLINSNTYGTLERTEEIPLSPSDMLLYTSDPAGTGDSFRVAYTIEPSADQAPGSYFGRLLFILFPIDSMQEQTIESINIYAELTSEGAVEISTDRGYKSLRISSKELDYANIQPPTVYINVKGNLGTSYRIYQQLEDALIKSDSGEMFDLTKVKYEVKESDFDKVIRSGALSELAKRTLLYSSDAFGTGKEIAVIYVPSDDFRLARADQYRGRIQYFLEMDRPTGILNPGLIDSVSVDFSVDPIFQLSAYRVQEDGDLVGVTGPLLEFGRIRYGGGTKESRVRVKVESNLGKPYAVAQRLNDPLQNEKGHKFPEELFTFVLSKEDDTGASLRFDKETKVKFEKDTTLFVSNSSGESGEFEITYKLNVGMTTHSGDYRTDLSYSLLEL